MKIENILEKIWIKKFEQDVYLTILKYNQIGAWKISKILNKPRSTIYSCIEKLKRNQFLFEQHEPSWVVYSVRWPQELIALLEKKKNDLERISTELKQHEDLFSEYQYINTSASKIYVHYWLEAIEVIQSNNPKEWWCFFWDINAFKETFNWSLEDIIKSFFEWEIYTSQSIMVESDLAIQYKKIVTEKYWKLHKIKFLPKSIKRLESDTMLMDNKYLHISYKNPITAIEVKNPTFFEAQKIMFEGLWASLE